MLLIVQLEIQMVVINMIFAGMKDKKTLFSVDISGFGTGCDGEGGVDGGGVTTSRL